MDLFKANKAMRKRKFDTSKSETELVNTSIHLAVLENNIKDLSKSLKENISDINARNQDKSTPIDLAISSGNFQAVTMILDTDKVDMNICNREGLTPLHQVIKNIEKFLSEEILSETIIEITKKIIAKVEKLDSQDRRGNTLINYVAQKAKANKPTTKIYTQIGKLLLSHDKNVSETVVIKNNMGKTPLDYLSRNGNLILRDATYMCRSSAEINKTISEIIADTELAIKKSSQLEKADA